MDRGIRYLCIMAAAMALASTANAVPVIAYEWAPAQPGTNSIFNSFHGAVGPGLADDFTPAVNGPVVRVDWWGNPGIGGVPNLWEITFHNDNPPGTPSYPFIEQHFVVASGADPDGDGVFFFSATWDPMDVLLSIGSDYWFSVANELTNNWLWADPGGVNPTVGSEQYDALRSIGGLPSIVPGPHDGPWLTTTADQNFAFRVWVEAPEPSSVFLLGAGALGWLATGWRRRRAFTPS